MQDKCVYKNIAQKRFANVLICEEKEVNLAEPTECFELHEDYFYIIEIFLLHRNSPYMQANKYFFL